VRRKIGPLSIALMMVSLAIAIALVSSFSSFAQPAGVGSQSAAVPQQITPTPTDASVAGSTDSIMWMGLLIVAIVLLPILLNRATWRKAP
jgi:hypothetical protein